MAESTTNEVKSFKLTIVADDSTPTFYINHAEVGCSKNEFAVQGVRVPTRISSEDISEDGVMKFDADVQLLVPITVVKGLVKALERQIEFYEKNFGKIEDR